MNPELICPPYILWTRRVRAGSDPSSPDPRPVIARPATHRRAISAIVARRATRRCTISALVARATLVAARFCTRCQVLRTRRRLIFFKLPYPSSRAADLSSRAVDPSSHAATRRCALRIRRQALRTRRRTLHTCRHALRTRRRNPSHAHPAPVRASPISTCAFSHFPTLCQSIPACTCHGDYLRDCPRGAKHFSSHVIHHY